MLEKIKGKHLLLDTNIIISASHYSKREIKLWDDFLVGLRRDFGVEFVIDWSVKFEFLRGSKTKSDFLGKEGILNFLVGGDRIELNIDDSVMKDAVELSNLYARKNPRLTKQISFADCLLAAQAKKFYSEKVGNQLFILSMDLFDFPLCIFDRIKIFTIDAKTEILNIGVFSFNQKKYLELKREFDKIKN
jgi:predicted nucleic acid-binding protein